MNSHELGTSFHMAGRPVPVDLTYDRSDPLAVSLSFPPENGQERRWLVSRDVLADGLAAPSGSGDVHVAPVPGAPGQVALTLSSPGGSAVLHADEAELRGYLDGTYDDVPRGAEYTDHDLDALVSALTGEDEAQMLPARAAVEQFVDEGYDEATAVRAVSEYLTVSIDGEPFDLSPWGVGEEDMAAIRGELGDNTNTPVPYALTDLALDECHRDVDQALASHHQQPDELPAAASITDADADIEGGMER